MNRATPFVHEPIISNDDFAAAIDALPEIVRAGLDRNDVHPTLGVRVFPASRDALETALLLLGGEHIAPFLGGKVIVIGPSIVASKYGVQLYVDTCALADSLAYKE